MIHRLLTLFDIRIGGGKGTQIEPFLEYLRIIKQIEINS
jgi:hypothetical protein